MNCNSCWAPRAKRIGPYVMCKWCFKYILGEINTINKAVQYLCRKRTEIERKRDARIEKHKP